MLCAVLVTCGVCAYPYVTDLSVVSVGGEGVRGAHGAVLAGGPHPEALLLHRDAPLVRHYLLKLSHCCLLLHPERFHLQCTQSW